MQWDKRAHAALASLGAEEGGWGGVEAWPCSGEEEDQAKEWRLDAISISWLLIFLEMTLHYLIKRTAVSLFF